jgi:hypothetical protein
MTSYINQLDAFVASRPGFDPANYSDAASYAADRRVASQAAADYRELRHVVGSPCDAALVAVTRGGRLSFGPDGVDYTAGQYPPTEYRGAACQVLARIWWAIKESQGYSAEDIRKRARTVFGRAIARRWFS